MVINPKNLIVCYKHKQTRGQKAMVLLMPLLFWGALLYIISTLCALYGCGIDYSLFENIIHYKDIQAIKAVITRYFPLIGVFVSVFMLWALYNKLRFQGDRNRRLTRPAPVTLDETVRFCQLDTQSVQGMQQAKNMICLFDNDGNIIQVKYPATSSHS